MADRDALVSQFCGITSVPPDEAEKYLGTNEWNLDAAVSEYYNSLEETEENADDDIIPSNVQPTQDTPISAGGGRKLGDGPTQQTSSSSTAAAAVPSAAAGRATRKKFATLGDLNSGSSAHAGHGHSGSDDDSDEGQNFFTGGKKSGLAVQDPNDVKRKILQKARGAHQRPQGDDPEVSHSHFFGNARTLGGDDAPSRVIEDPNASIVRPAEPVERILHFWRNGFSVDDGPLFRDDDPSNAQLLHTIRSGRAPLEIMNVRHDQQVDVKVEPHEEDYVQPKKKYIPFGGGGQRLGSPTPAILTSPPANRPVAAVAPHTPASTSAHVPKVEVDNTQPIISLQVRLGDGTRLVSRFNTTHTIGDVYSFVNASSASSQSRPWVLMTTFPSKELSDKSQVLGDLAEFKRGGSVVQKWQ